MHGAFRLNNEEILSVIDPRWRSDSFFFEISELKLIDLGVSRELFRGGLILGLKRPRPLSREKLP